MIKEKINAALKDKIARSSITNLFIKPISLILSFIYTPLLLSYLGDEKYGKKGYYPLALFAYKLEFNHPTTKEKLRFTILPEEGYFKQFDLKNKDI